MKKIFTFVLFVFALSGTGSAQVNEYLVSKKGEAYLPQQGDWSIGFEANDLFRYFGSFLGNGNNGAPDLTLINNSFVGKYMDTDYTAYRVLADFRYDNKKNVIITRGTTSDEKDITETEKTGAFDLKLGLGREWRKGATRLQGYFGGDALIGVNTSSRSARTNNPNDEDTPNYEVKSRRGLGFSVGARGFLGAEYFILPKMAVGAEYSYGLWLNTRGEGRTSETGEDDVKSGNKNSQFYLGGEDNSNYGVLSLKLSLYF